MFCKKCGKKLSDNTVICPVCGEPTGMQPTPFPQPKPTGMMPPYTPPQPPIHPDPAPQVSYCPKCGNAVAPNAEFCLHCGCVLNNINPQDGGFAAIMKTNKKRNILIAIILMLFIVIIAFILFRIFESNESKIQGKWLLYSDGTELVDKEDQVTWEFTNGRLLISGAYSEEGYYSIDGDTLEIYDDDYRVSKLLGHSKRYVIEKLSSNKLILRKINTDRTYVFKRL